MQQEQLNDWLGWLEDLEHKHPVDWTLLPDIGLYMDQVQTLIDRQLGLYRHDDQDRLLTPAMINNYIKDGLIPRAEAKKYNPTHLALLIMIAPLKQVLSIQNLNRLFKPFRDATRVAALYERFRAVQQKALHEAAAQARQAAERLQPPGQSDSGETAPGDGQESSMRQIALELAIQARARILIAERILTMLDQPAEPASGEKKKDKSKPKPQTEVK
jgi:hypothetical protein